MAYQDNCPTAVLEAMSCGLPILYSSSGGIPELVDKECGWGIKVQENWKRTQIPNKSDIVDGMREIITNKSHMSQASRIRAVENFDIKKWALKHEQIFERFIDQ